MRKLNEAEIHYVHKEKKKKKSSDPKYTKRKKTLKLKTPHRYRLARTHQYNKGKQNLVQKKSRHTLP